MRDIRPARRLGSEAESTELYESTEETKRLTKTRREASPVPVTTIPVATPPTLKQERRAPRVGAGERKILLGAFFLALVVGGLAAFIFLPTATIAMRLRTAPLLVEEEVVIGSEGAVAAGNAFFREVAVTGVVPVENREKVGTRAAGEAMIVNSSTQEQPLREQSRLQTPDGRIFHMVRHAIVPAGTRARVPIEAAAAGEEGNIGPQRLDFVALDATSRQLIYAEVEQPLTGGSGAEIAVVSEADLARAQENAAASARTEVELEIREQLPHGWSLVEESWTGEIASFTPEAVAGDKIPEIKYSASVIVRVMGLEQENVLRHLREMLAGHLDAEFMLFPGPISYTKSVKSVNWEANEITLAVRMTHTTIPHLSLDTLKTKLAGRTQDEARTYLEGLPGVQGVEIMLWPFWVGSIPRIEQRISLELTPERQLEGS